MDHILFVTNRNILTTCGELRLIKNRAEALFNDYNISTDFIALAKKSRIVSEKRETIDAGGMVDSIEMSMGNPAKLILSYIKLKRKIREKLSIGEYRGVIVSGTVMPILVRWIKKEFPVSVYIDMHGAFEDILEVSKKNRGAKKAIFSLLYYFDRLTTGREINCCDGVFVVTGALRYYLKRMFPKNKDIDYYIVPCATDMKPMLQSEYLEDRTKYRKKYGIEAEQIVFVYSGGVSSWQCIKETIELYQKVSKEIKQSSKMLIFSHNMEEVYNLTHGDENIVVDSYSPDELFHALRVGDFAFLLRKDNKTNNVAFPNKYLEYVQSNMRIITTPYVYEIADQVERYSLGYIWDFDDDVNELVNYINVTINGEYRGEDIESVLTLNSFQRTLVDFAERITNGENKQQ